MVDPVDHGEPDVDDEFDVGAHHHPARCEHPSSSGIDSTIDGPAKVWRCHSCNAMHLADGTRVLAPEVVERWDNFWAEMVTRRDGTVDVDQVKCELYDYWVCIDEVPKVYGEITGNAMSKPNYLASEVIGVHNERCPNVTYLIEDIREWLREYQPRPGQDWSEHVDALEEEVLRGHETLHNRMYREEREKEPTLDIAGPAEP